MYILGIDPGIANTGWGIIDFAGQKFQPVCYGVINTLKTESLERRVASIAESVSQIIEKYQIKCISMEEIYFAKNEGSAIGVAKVIGAITYVAYKHNTDVFMFTPMQIKISITGYGMAEKKQVQEMCRILLKLDKIPRPDHAADALAAAVCFCNTNATVGKLGINR